MAKVQIKSEKTIPFGGFFLILEKFNGHVEKSVDVVRNAAFSQEDTFDSLADTQMHLMDTCNGINGSPLSIATKDIVERSEEDIAAKRPLTKEITNFENATYHIDKYGTAFFNQ